MVIIFNSNIDTTLKIFGNAPNEATHYTVEYDCLLIRKLSENINYLDQERLTSLIDETLQNATFANVSRIDAKMLKAIISEIKNTF